MSDFSQRIANLSPEKLELLASRLARRDGPRPQGQTISRRQPPGDRAPLSYAQRRMWILYQLDPTSAAFNIPTAVRLRGPLNPSALGRSLSEVVRRHESLRTTFDEVEGRPVQLINEPAEWRLPTVDLSHVPAAAREAEAHSLAAAGAGQVFDLRRGPVMRTTLVRLAAEEHLLLLVVHHIVSDGWSMGLLVREVKQLYGAYVRGVEPQLPELPLQYADYAEWQMEWLAGDEMRRQFEYWRGHLAGAPPFLELQADRERPPVLSHTGAGQLAKLDDGLARGARELARQSGVTTFTLMLAVFMVLLCRHTRREDVVVGTNSANRNRGAIQNLIGFFVNDLVLRADLSGNPTFRECLDRVGEVTLEAYAHQDVPFELLVEELRPERVRNHTPLFQVMFLLQKNSPLTSLSDGLELSPVNVESRTAAFDLTMIVEEGARETYIHLTYDTELFLPSTVGRMLQHYQNLLRSVVNDPGQRIAALSMSTQDESEKVLDDFNAAFGEDN